MTARLATSVTDFVMLNRPIKFSKIYRVAICSRIIVFCLQFIALHLPLHENDGFKFDGEENEWNSKRLDSIVKFMFGGFTNWDGQYFLHITKHGYSYLKTIAFFPLYPTLVWVGTKILEVPFSGVLSFSSIAIVVSFLLNLYFFVRSAQVLYRLVPYFDSGHESLCTLSVILFCFNPASIFFSAFYSECLFSYLTLQTLLALFERKKYRGIWFASLSAVCRSNGILNFGFCLAFGVQEALGKYKKSTRFEKLRAAMRILWEFALVTVGLLPFAWFQLYCFQKFCDSEHVFPLPGFCFGTQLPYQYIQSENWNVGFLKYFEMKQLPNFLLAAPVLFTLGKHSFPGFLEFIRNVIKRQDFSSLDLASTSVHGSFLTIFCFTSMHVQVSTRLILSSCPYLYVLIGKTIRTEIFEFRLKSKSVLTYSLYIHTWFLIYFLVGCFAFPAGYPWT